MAVQIQVRRGTAAQWTATNPNLAAGEIGFETDTNRFKIGTGISWNTTAYAVQQVTTLAGMSDVKIAGQIVPLPQNNDLIRYIGGGTNAWVNVPQTDVVDGGNF